MSTVCCGRATDDVGLIATRTTIGSPVDSPPSSPPELFERVRTSPFSTVNESFDCEPRSSRDLEAFANLDALDRRNTVHGMTDQAVQLVERRLAQSDRHIQRMHLDDAAQAVVLGFDRHDGFDHLFCRDWDPGRARYCARSRPGRTSQRGFHRSRSANP